MRGATPRRDCKPPYRVYWTNAGLPAGTQVEVTATVADGSGRVHADWPNASLGDRS